MREFMAIFLASTVALASAPAWAGPRAGGGDHRPSAGRVQISVDVVHATDAESGVDPRLASFASQFRVFKYRGYRLLSTQSADVAPGGDHTFAIEGGRSLSVTLVSKDDTHARVRVEVSGKKGKLIDTTVKINRDGSFIVAGPNYKDGILILPLQVSY